MDTQWRSAIDRTLRSTQATLQRLQERHANYDQAKRRAHEALSLAASSDDDNNDDHNGDDDDGHRHGQDSVRAATRHADTTTSATARSGRTTAAATTRSRYRGDSRHDGDDGSCACVVDVDDKTRAHALHRTSGSRKHRTTSTRHGHHQHNNNSNNDDDDVVDAADDHKRTDAATAAAAATASALPYSLSVCDVCNHGSKHGNRDDMMQAMRLQLHGLHVALERERGARSSATREMQARVDGELSELRHVVRQLRDENAYLTTSLHTLEAQCAFGHHISNINDNNSRHATTARAIDGGGGMYTSSYWRDSATTTTTTNASMDSVTAQLRTLQQRVGDVEARVLQQSQSQPHGGLLERAQRTEAVLRPLVTAAVSAEVERVRAVAREAARAHVDGAVAASVSAATAAAEAEMQRTASAASVAAERTLLLERQLQQREQASQRRLQQLDAAVQQLQQQQQQQRGSRDVSGEATLAESVRALERRCAAVERDVHGVRTVAEDAARQAVDAAHAATRAATTAAASGDGALTTTTTMTLSAKTRAELLAAVDDAVASHTRHAVSDATVTRRIDAAVQSAVDAVRREVHEKMDAAVAAVAATAARVSSSSSSSSSASTAAALADMRQWWLTLQAQLSQQCAEATACSTSCAQSQDALQAEMQSLRTRVDALAHTVTTTATATAAAAAERARARSRSVAAAAADDGDDVDKAAEARQREAQLQDKQRERAWHERLCACEAQLQSLCSAHATTRDTAHEARQHCAALEARVQQAQAQAQQQHAQHEQQLQRQRDEHAMALPATIDAAVARALQPLAQSLQSLEAAMAQRCEGPLRTLAADAQRTSERVRQLQTRVQEVETATAAQLHDAQGSVDARVSQLERAWRHAVTAAQRECAQRHDACTTTLTTLQDHVQTLQQQQLQRESASVALPSMRDVRDAVRAAVHDLDARVADVDAALQTTRRALRRQQHAAAARAHTRRADTAWLHKAVRTLRAYATRQSHALACGQARLTHLERRAAAAMAQQQQELQQLQWQQQQQQECKAALDAHVAAAAQLQASWRECTHQCDELHAVTRRLQEQAASHTADVQHALHQMRDDVDALASRLPHAHVTTTAKRKHNNSHYDHDNSHDDGKNAMASDGDASDGETTDGDANALAMRLRRVEATTEQGLLAMTDTLSSLRDGLHACVACARATLQRHGGGGNSSNNEHADVTQRHDEGGAAVPYAASSSSSSDTTDEHVESSSPTLQSLEDVFAFVMEQLCVLRSGAAALQVNAFATLELIQQQEVDLAAIAPLQRAVLQLSFALVPVARAVGVDPALFQLQLQPLVGGSGDSDGGATSDESKSSSSSSTSERSRAIDATRVDMDDDDDSDGSRDEASAAAVVVAPTRTLTSD